MQQTINLKTEPIEKLYKISFSHTLTINNMAPKVQRLQAELDAINNEILRREKNIKENKPDKGKKKNKKK